MKRTGIVFLWICIGLLGGLGQFIQPAEAVAITVNTTNDDFVNNANCSLREAIRAANTNIMVDACPAGSNTLTDVITLTSGANYAHTITGIDDTGIAGDFDITNNTAATDIQFVTSGAGAATVGSVGYTDRHFHILAGATVTMTNLTIRYGDAPNGGVLAYTGGGILNEGNLTLTTILMHQNLAYDGAGIYNTGALTLNSNSMIQTNFADNYGGGIYNDGTLTIADSNIHFNVTQWAGGGIYNGGTLNTQNVFFFNNTGTFGGGIYNELTQTATLNNTDFALNVGEWYGGGIYNRGLMTISNNSVVGSYGGQPNNSPVGGGIFNADNTLTIDASHIVGNTAEYGGGIYNYSTGTVTLQNNTSLGEINYPNEATKDGGGINNHGTFTAQNITIQSNRASYAGGGIYNIATMNLNAVTVGGYLRGNSASLAGGGIYHTGGSATSTITNSVIDYNNSLVGGGLHNNQTLTITGSQLDSNSANLGGGIYSTDVLTLDNTDVSNNAALKGGGIYTTNVVNVNNGSLVIYNTAQNGGGAYSADGNINVDNSYLSANSASNQGGGIDNEVGGVSLQNNAVISNNTAQFGGGIYNFSGSTLTADNSDLYGNHAYDGGAIYSFGAVSLQNGSEIGGGVALSNTALRNGGGIFNAGGLTIANSNVSFNTATQWGGGLFHSGNLATSTITGSRFLTNSATMGGALYNLTAVTNAISVTGSCIVDNTHVGVVNATAFNQIATGNWWGAVDGPGPQGLGSGDTVSTNVNYSGFLTSPILGCQLRTTPSATITPTPSNTFTPSNTPTPTNTFTATSTASDTPNATATTIPPSNTPTATATGIPPTDTSMPSVTDTPNATATDTPMLTPTDTMPAPTVTETSMPTVTLIPSLTFTPSNTVCVAGSTAPSLISPVHRAHTTDTTPTFSWSGDVNAQSYRLMIYTEDRSFEYKKRIFVSNYTLAAGEALTPAKYLWRARTQDLTCGTWSSWSGRNTLFVD